MYNEPGMTTGVGGIHDARYRLPNAERFARTIRDDRLDLSGGLRFSGSARSGSTAGGLKCPQSGDF
jgi:hypothetical protein